MRLGWQAGMNVHNMLMLIAYLLIGTSIILGMPRSLAWPGLLTLPIGLYQIYQMVRVANGAPPPWRLMRLIAAALPGMMAYLFIIALWTN